MFQTAVKRKRSHPAKSAEDAELQKSTNEVASKSPLQAISMVSPQQPSCSSILDSATPNTEALVVNTDFYVIEDIQEEETVSVKTRVPKVNLCFVVLYSTTSEPMGQTLFI